MKGAHTGRILLMLHESSFNLFLEAGGYSFRHERWGGLFSSFPVALWVPIQLLGMHRIQKPNDPTLPPAGWPRCFDGAAPQQVANLATVGFSLKLSVPVAGASQTADARGVASAGPEAKQMNPEQGTGEGELSELWEIGSFCVAKLD